MNLGDPKKRRPLRNDPSLDEIKDNVKNHAVLTQSRSKTKYRLSNSGDEELLNLEITKDLHQTFTINSSFRNIETRYPGSAMNERRNSGSNMNQRRHSGSNENQRSPKLRSQSPEARDREPHNFINTSDISDDEEDEEEILENSHNKPSPVYRPKYCANYRPRLPSKKPQENNSNFGMYFVLSVIFIGILATLYLILIEGNSVGIGKQTEAFDVYSESHVLDDVLVTFRNMKSKYKNQNRNLWQDAYASIASLINQETKKPSIIVLLGNKSNPLECLARLIGNVSGKALRSDRLVLTPKEFEADMGSVLQTMRSHLKDNKAIIVSDLLNINVEALKAFHNLCDRVNPLVEEAIYIITVIADDYDDDSNPLQYIETELYKKLSGKMEKDAIQPLITRLTDGPILTVKPEPTVTDCSL